MTMNYEWHNQGYYDESPVTSPTHFQVVADVYPTPETPEDVYPAPMVNVYPTPAAAGDGYDDQFGFVPIQEGFVNDGLGDEITYTVPEPIVRPRVHFQDTDEVESGLSGSHQLEDIQMIQVTGSEGRNGRNHAVIGNHAMNGFTPTTQHHTDDAEEIEIIEMNGHVGNGGIASHHNYGFMNGGGNYSKPYMSRHVEDSGAPVSFEEFLRTATIDSEVFVRTLSSDNSHNRVFSKEKQWQYPHLLSSGSVSQLGNRMQTLQKASLGLRDPTSGVDQMLLLQAFTQLYREYLHQREQSLSEAPKWEKTWKKTKQYWVDWSPNYEVWKEAFKEIEGRHGGAACAYFRFLKWLFFMNVFVTVFICGVFIIPHQVLDPDSFTDAFPANYNLTRELRAAAQCSASYQTNLTIRTNEGGTGGQVVDFFIGEGWLEDTALFLGYYFDKVYYYGRDGMSTEPLVVYNSPVAYLFMTLAYFIILLIVMVIQTGKGLRDNLVSSGSHHNKYCVKIFTAWDFSLRSKKASDHRHRSINIEFKNDLVAARLRLQRQTMSYQRRFCIILIRIVIWILVLASWAGAFYLIIQVVGQWTPELMTRENVRNSDFLTLLVNYLPSLTLTVLNVVLPSIFYKIVQVENYTPESEIKITLARTVILRLASVGVLVFSLQSQIADCNNENNLAAKVCGNCLDTTECWESYVGQQFYRLVLLDFFIIIAISLFVILPRRIIVDKLAPRNKLIAFMDRQEFEIPIQILELVYSQTISWIGGFFSPLIPLITLFKFFVFFYIKKWTLLNNCIFAAKPYRASKSNYFFMVILLFAYVLSALSISYAIGRINPSQSCGPWRVYEDGYPNYHMYHSISAAVRDFPSAARTILRILSNWIIYVLLLVILCLVIYYNYSMTAGSKRRTQLLKYQLALEGQDRQFLMKEVNRVIATQRLPKKASRKSSKKNSKKQRGVRV